MKKFTIVLADGLYLHNNPVKTILDPLKTTTNINKAKVWEKKGMLETWANSTNHAEMLNRDGYKWKIHEVNIIYTLGSVVK